MFRELVHFIRYFRLSKEKRALVFYSEHEGYTAYYQGILDELTKTHQRPVVYVTSDPSDPIFKNHGPLIVPLYLKTLLPFFFQFLNCQVMVLTVPDLHKFHLRRSVNPVRYVYVFHSMVSTHMMYRAGAFDSYDVMLCVGPHQVEEIERQEEIDHLPQKKIIHAGYYRLERIQQAFKEQPNLANDKPCILIAPSWGAENIIETCGEELVAQLLGEGFRVILRPHPEMMRRSPEKIALLKEKFRDNPHFTFEGSVSTDDSLLKADVLISDWSGVALEYAFGTDRPVLFLDVPRKVHNPTYERLGIEPIEVTLRTVIGQVVPPRDVTRILAGVRALLIEKDIYQGRIAAARGKYVFAPGESSRIGARAILDEIEVPS